MPRAVLDDLRYSLRMLLRAPGFAALAILTLALGTGATTAIFSIVNAVLLRPLPYNQPDRIVQISAMRGPGGPTGTPLSYPKFSLLAGNTRAFDGVAAVSYARFHFGDDARHELPIEVSGVRVSRDFFRVLGVTPLLGRTFSDQENREGGDLVAILSYALWQSRFAGDPHVIGRSVAIDGGSTTVVGVMGPDFHFPSSSDLWVPRVFESTLLTRLQIENGGGFLFATGRLAPGVGARQATAELQTFDHQYDQNHPGFTDAGSISQIEPLRDQLVGNVRATLWILLGAVALVLLIAAANVANLLLARVLGRQKEIAIRAALGAGKARLVRQFLTESLLLAAVGAGVGLAIAFSIVPLVAKLGPDVLPRSEEVHISGAVLAFTTALAVLTGILFGLAPALQASGMDLNEALKSSGRGMSGGLRGVRLRSLLMVSEVTLAAVLLTGAGLLIRSFLQLGAVDPGFRKDHRLTMRIGLPSLRYPESAQRSRFYDQLLERVASLPGVHDAAVNSALPLAGAGIFYFFNIEGHPSLGPGRDPTTRLESINPGYFETMGIPLLNGRAFSNADRAETPTIAVINQAFARHYWPNDNPIGRHLTYSREHITCEIVGVVGDTKYAGLDAQGPAEQMYVPYRQRAWLAMWLVARAAGDAASLTSAIRHEVLAIDPDQPVSEIRTMEDVVSDSVARPRLRTAIMGSFATLAMILAMIGIFGVMAWSVSERTNEIGIRMALGAEPGQVRWMIVRQGLATIAIGQLLGLLGALLLSRALSSMLFGVSAEDPVALLGVNLLLGAAALLACWLAARRATSVDPLIALARQ